jgi:hypothetical protein
MGSLEISVHRPSQRVSPCGHTQAPPTQAVPAGQALPHAPQFDASLDVATHELPHSVSPTAQAAWQEPLEHVRPALQTWPHEPQLSSSVPVLLQAPWQDDCPAGHETGAGALHTPLWQVVPLGHCEVSVHVCATTWPAQLTTTTSMSATAENRPGPISPAL